MILAAGEGSRLRPLTRQWPKTLLPVANRPLLARLLDQIAAAGLRRATVTLPPTAEAKGTFALAAAPPGFDLRVVFPRGAFRGTVHSATDVLDPAAERALVIYGDSLIDLDFGRLVEEHEAARRDGAGATIVSHRPADLRVPETGGRTYHGVMAVASNGHVTRFVEKPLVEAIGPRFNQANAAVFICERWLLSDDRFRDAADFSIDIFSRAANGERSVLRACDIGGGFRLDIGSVERLFEANLAALHGDIPVALNAEQIRPMVYCGQSTSLDGVDVLEPVLLGRGVRLAPGATVGPDAVVGNDCVVEGGARISRAVVMDGCVVHRHAIVDTCVLAPFSVVGAGVRLPRFSVLATELVSGDGEWPTYQST